MDNYLEFLIKKKFTFGRILLVVLLYLVALILSFGVLILSLGNDIIMQFSVFVIAIIFFGVWWLHKKLRLEYEYIVTNDELDVDRITAKRMRRRLLTVSVRKFDEFGIVDDKTINSKKAQVKVVLDASIGKGSINRYYAIFNNKQGNRMLLIFNPTSKMIDVFKLYNPQIIG